MAGTIRTGRRVTAADVARSLGLSRATVGFVLNNTPGQTIPEATRARVITEAERLGYRPHRAARALASGQSAIVLFVLPEWPIEYAMRVHLEEASLVLDRAGYSLVTTTRHSDGQAVPLWETLSPDVVLGMVPFSADELDGMRRSGVRRVIPDEPGLLEAPAIAVPGFADGPRRQIEHLVSRGRRRIAFAGSPDPRIAEIVAGRRSLARETLKSLARVDLAADADLDESNAADVVRAWMAAGVDAVAAYNDDIAALVAGTALRSGIRIPEDLAVIGHDDTPIARLFVPSLTSVRVDSADLGRYVAEIALSAARGTPPPDLRPEAEATVIPRESA